MKVSLKWLSEYVEVPPLEELVQRLTMAGLEVEGVERPGAALEGVVVARIQESAPHPNADKLSVTKVDAGGPAPLQIVCGAKNYKAGDLVPLATVGTKLPGGTEIKKAALRGVESSGMLCSERELGLSEEASGLMILEPSLRPGTPIAQALGLDDAVLEVNVTPNRPDALSHLGIAREVAVLARASLRRPEPKLKESARAASEAVRIRIDDPARCPRYAGRVVEGVTVGPSPSWMKRRLELCGVRSINNVVDVTNYVMLESGQPLHAFDLDKVGGAEIVVRLARPGEKLISLDGKARELDPDDLVIADREKAQAIGGVMGGAESEVSASTRRVLLEVANFLPATVRRSAKRHALHTEASHRFERGVDVDGVPWVIDRAAALLAEVGQGTVLQGRADVYPAPVKPRQVRLRHAKVRGLLGAEIPREECRRILEALGFRVVAVEAGEEAVAYEIPAGRVDVEREEDLVEEVARIHGYERIPIQLPRGVARLVPEPKELEIHARVRGALSGRGFDEVLNYSFLSPKEQPWVAPGPPEGMGKDRDWICLSNPLSLEQSVMRESLYGGLLQNVARNLRHQPAGLRFYELGRVYRVDPEGGKKRRPVAREPLHAAGVLWGLREGRTWTSKDAAVDFYDAKGAVEAVLEALSIRGAAFEPREGVPYHPRASAAVMLGGAEVGTLGELHPKSAKALGVPQALYLFELDVDALAAHARLEPAFEEIGKYPAVLRDLAVVVDAAMPQDALRAVIREVGGELLEEATVFDVYTGKPIPEGKKNLAYALRYRANDRTLTDAEVNQAHGRIVEELDRRLKGSLRGQIPQ